MSWSIECIGGKKSNIKRKEWNLQRLKRKKVSSMHIYFSPNTVECHTISTKVSSLQASWVSSVVRWDALAVVYCYKSICNVLSVKLWIKITTKSPRAQQENIFYFIDVLSLFLDLTSNRIQICLSWNRICDTSSMALYFFNFNIVAYNINNIPIMHIGITCCNIILTWSNVSHLIMYFEGATMFLMMGNSYLDHTHSLLFLSTNSSLRC